MKAGMSAPDKGIAPIRAVRHEISREFGHDARKYVAYLRGLDSSTFAKQIRAYRKIMAPALMGALARLFSGL